MPAEVIQVIRTDIQKRGQGMPDNPVRRIIQYWSFEGELLAEFDPWKYEREREEGKQQHE